MYKYIKYKIRKISVNARYQNKLKKLKPKKQLTVLFLVSQNEKWSCDSLFRAMQNDTFFDPKICIIPLTAYDSEKTESTYKENVDFFKNKGFQILDGYDFENNTAISLSIYKPDIIFYQQQWDLLKPYKINVTSRYALTCYVPYSILLSKNTKHFSLNFQHLLWKIFLDSPSNLKRFKKYMHNNAENCVVSGYPKLDFYLENTADANRPRTVIYAPHHSFEKTGLGYATFAWNGAEILNFAKKNPDVHFVFKPHPRFKFAIVKNGIMTQAEIDAYYQAWQNLKNGSVHGTGDYMNLFLNSTAMITDCSSFLGEYYFTGNPLIHLISKNSAGQNELGENISKNYYQVHNLTELKTTLHTVITENKDPLKDKRLRAKNGLAFPENGSGNYIKEYLKNIIQQGSHHVT